MGVCPAAKGTVRALVYVYTAGIFTASISAAAKTGFAFTGKASVGVRTISVRVADRVRTCTQALIDVLTAIAVKGKSRTAIASVATAGVYAIRVCRAAG
jgi:hypothetical protein